MIKYGRVSRTISLICQAYAIQLAVQDIFYAKDKPKNKALTEEQGDDDEEEDNAEEVSEGLENQAVEVDSEDCGVLYLISSQQPRD